MSLPEIARVEWDAPAAATALRVSLARHLSMRMDGRKATAFVADWLASNGFAWVEDGVSGQFLQKEGTLYRVRAITTKIDFGASVMRGAGRKFSSQVFNDGIALFDAFLIFDAMTLPSAPVYAVTVPMVISWIADGTLSPEASTTRGSILQAIGSYNTQGTLL